MKKKSLLFRAMAGAKMAIGGLVLGGLVAAAPGHAQPPEAAASPWFKTDQTSVRLISAVDKAGDGDTVRLGLQFKLKKGWKIYWRNPGDAGFPPSLDWTGSENLKGAEFGWPAPTRFEVIGFQTMGYKKEVVFPITASVKKAGGPLKLRAKLNYLACDDICIPYSTDLTLNVGQGAGNASPHFQLIDKFANLVPGDGARHGLAIDTIEMAGSATEVEKDIRKGFVRVVATSQVPFTNPDVFIEGPELAFFSVPTVTLSNGGRQATLRVPVTLEEDTKILKTDIRLTLIDGNRSAERTLRLTQGAASGPPAGGSLPLSLSLVLALAVVGGLILNLMPCVLPVISLKVLSVAAHGGAEKRVIRKSFIASSLGILFSFLVIASGLAALKAAGSAVGWGIQFQHPWFIVGLTVIVLLFAYNLWGLFELRLPSFVGGLAGGGAKPADHQSFAGNFGTGAFATVLATPCSAPFLGTAVGFALAGRTIDIFMIFAALGFGMALPFLLIAVAPGLASMMPKPGNWMNRMKQVLGGLLALTALWLLSVLAVQIGLKAAIIVGALMVAIGFLLIGQRHGQAFWRRAASAGLVLVILGAFAAPYQYAPVADTDAVSKSNAHWVAFDPASIPRLVGEGKTVFVDITAEWCITCLVNKAAVLNRGKVFELLSGDQVIAMQGDWTRPDPIIAAYLKSFGRFGIPFNAIYGPGKEDGLALPELLTTGLVMDGLASASANAITTSRQASYMVLGRSVVFLKIIYSLE
jgi:suppressor for copper-sensitivity B